MFYAGARFVTTGHNYRTFDWGMARGMVDHLLSTYGHCGSRQSLIGCVNHRS